MVKTGAEWGVWIIKWQNTWCHQMEPLSLQSYRSRCPQVTFWNNLGQGLYFTFDLLKANLTFLLIRRFCCSCVGVNTVLFSFNMDLKKTLSHPLVYVSDLENSGPESSTASYVPCGFCFMLLLHDINIMINNVFQFWALQWSYIKDTGDREKLVSETRNKTKTQDVLGEETPQIWAEFSPMYPDQENITLEISLYEDRLPLWVFHISSCQIYLKHDIRQRHLIIFCCFFLRVMKEWKKLGTIMKL